MENTYLSFPRLHLIIAAVVLILISAVLNTVPKRTQMNPPSQSTAQTLVIKWPDSAAMDEAVNSQTINSASAIKYLPLRSLTSAASIAPLESLDNTRTQTSLINDAQETQYVDASSTQYSPIQSSGFLRTSLPILKDESESLPPTSQNSLSLTPLLEAVTEGFAAVDTVDSGAHSQFNQAQLQARYDWQDVVIRSGDSLSTLFNKVGLSARDVYQFTRSSNSAKKLTQLYPGHVMGFLIDKGKLVQLRYQPSLTERLLFTQNEDSFTVENQYIEPDRFKVFKQARIDSSLFLAAKKTGLSADLIMRLADIFAWDIDFILDVRQGDEFSVLFEESVVDGQKAAEDTILAAEFVNQGETFRAFRYTDSANNTLYYSEQGTPLRKAFLRAPLSFKRISSHFSSKRKHPILNRIRAHKGIDYSADHGTPVKATSDGKVVYVGRKGSFGKLIVIKHGERYQTKYAHLSSYAKGVRSGQRVKQGQTIGYVGMTGGATGPHLHYEFLVNGVHRNPRTILNKLPSPQPLGSTELARFNSQKEALALQLDAYSASMAQLSEANP